MTKAKVVQVIEVVTTRGEGSERDPIRYVTQYWSFKGQLLGERDPVPARVGVDGGHVESPEAAVPSKPESTNASKNSDGGHPEGTAA